MKRWEALPPVLKETKIFVNPCAAFQKLAAIANSDELKQETGEGASQQVRCDTSNAYDQIPPCDFTGES